MAGVDGDGGPRALPLLRRSSRNVAPPTPRRPGVVLAISRLVVATVLLGGTLALSGGDPAGPSARLTLALVVLAYIGSIVSAVALERGLVASAVLGSQITLDLVLTSGLVYVTDGAHSGFASLYAIVVLGAALSLGAGAALRTTGVALTLYLTIGLATASGWIPVPDDRFVESYSHSPSDLALAVLRTAVGLLLVGGLSASLSDRLLRARGDAARATERAAGYERLTEDIVRSMSAGLLTTDETGVVESANALAGEILGRPHTDLLGQRITALLPLAGDVSAGALERSEAEVERPDGSVAWIGFSRTPLVGPDGATHGALVIFSDLSELRALRQMAERAERLAALGQLAAGLAHEIRNPLGSISGSVQLVREAADLPDEDRRLLDLVVTETTRLDQLVGTMLQIGRPSLPERVEIDLTALLRDVLGSLRNEPALVLSRQITLELESEAPVMAYADPSQIRQLAWNLLKNAVQVSPHGGRVFAGATETDGGAALAVRDEGPGIPAKDRAKLFDAFFSRRTHGVGLGLALCRSIVDAHGGQIEVDGEPGRGTTFRVTLPRRAGASSPSPEPAPV